MVFFIVKLKAIKVVMTIYKCDSHLKHKPSRTSVYKRLYINKCENQFLSYKDVIKPKFSKNSIQMRNTAVT